ncbi:hypothetical protein D9619_010597 [Psilocybe cf. subviscida]|uniref:Uncharacterized protein n=1 Tax=Psilocybe cf. subviscida TaxID=2480587 RepID=A0A8H5ASE9_9AGAR|nr:hypothetical protein D9619_010597 [Psilocybe cf. subviscida]
MARFFLAPANLLPLTNEGSWATLAIHSKPSKSCRAMPPTSSLENLDVDIARTIMCCMDLECLYNLAHAVPSYGALLRNPGDSRLIWQGAYDRVEGIPTCPSDLTNFRYIALAFVRHCDLCRKSIAEKSALYIDWSNRLRTCVPCVKKHYKKFGTLNRQKSVHYDWTPILPKVKIRSHIKHSVDYYLPSVLKKWDEAYNDVNLDSDEKFQWRENKITERSAVEKHARACRLWDLHRRADGPDSQLTQRMERMSILLSRIDTLGWQAEMDMIPPTRQQLLEQNILPFTTSDRFDALIIQHMEQARDLRDSDKKSRKIQSRKGLLESLQQRIFRETLDEIPLSELYRLSLDPTLLSDNTDLKLRSADIPALAKVFLSKWVSQTTDKLFEMTVKALPDFAWECPSHDDKVCVLGLAIAFFSCSICSPEGRYPLTYKQAMVHKCALQPVRHRADLDQYLIGEILGQSFWNYERVISFSTATLECMRMVIRHAQVPPPIVGMPAPAVDEVLALYMDAGRLVYECVTCNDPTKGRCIMNWRAVVRSVYQTGILTSTLRLLSTLKVTHIQVVHASMSMSDMASLSLGRINPFYGGHTTEYSILQVKAVEQMNSSGSPSFICPFLRKDCVLNRKLTFSEMASHLQEHHQGTHRISDASIVYAPDKNDVVEACRIWPPRDQLVESAFDPLISQLRGVSYLDDYAVSLDI